MDAGTAERRAGLKVLTANICLQGSSRAQVKRNDDFGFALRMAAEASGHAFGPRAPVGFSLDRHVPLAPAVDPAVALPG